MEINNSVLLDIKGMIGLEGSYKVYDRDISMYINSSLSILKQLGILKNNVNITGESETWDMLDIDHTNLDIAKVYIYLRTRLMFDPPSNSFTVDSLNNVISEYEWRMLIRSEDDQ